MERRGQSGGAAARMACGLLALAALATSCRAAAGEPRTYVLAIVPQGPPVAAHARWAPLAERLGRAAGVKLELKLYEGIEEFEASLVAGKPDLAYANPLQAVLAWNAHRYVPLVRSSTPITGNIYVRQDSSLGSVEALRGREVAFSGQRNVCAVLLRDALAELGIVPHFVGTPTNVFKHVLVGEEVAGGALDVALTEQAPEVAGAVRSLYRTRPIASHPLLARPSVPLEVREAIVRAVLRTAEDAEGRALLQGVRLQAPVRADYDRDYAPLRRLVSPIGPERP